MTGSATELSLERCLDRRWLDRRALDRPWRSGSGGLSIAVVAEVGSTNGVAREVARLYLDGGRVAPRLALIARHQTAGRGRRGRDWASPAGQGIYTSLLLPLAGQEALAALPLRVPLALCEALEPLGVDCGIKWPNDLMVGGRKLGGVLIESLGGRAAIVGYGLNGSQGEAELPIHGATSLRLASGKAPDLSRLAVELAVTLAARLATAEPEEALLAAYRKRSVHRPGETMRCRLADGELSGRFAGFDAQGMLRLQTAAGERLLGSAEIVAGEPVPDRAGEAE